MEIRIIKQPITRQELERIAKERYGDMVKAVVDLEHEVMAVGGEFHADGELALVEQEGAQREYTWGINLYPDNTGDDFVEFDSMINLKPAFGNRTRGIEDEKIREKIRNIVYKLIKE